MTNKKNKTRITDPTRVLTLANFISLGRALLAIPIVFSMQDISRWHWTLFLAIIAIISDALDGYFARKAHEVTHIGKWLDPIADFAVIFTVIFFLVLSHRFPTWFFMLYLGRVVTIALPALYLINHTDLVLSANRSGKVFIALSAAMLCLYIFPIPNMDWFRILMTWIAALALVISWGQYLYTMILEYRKL